MAASPNVSIHVAAPLHPGLGRWQPGAVGSVHLNGIPVGTVTVTGWDASWGFGRFCPDGGFSQFAPAFGRWSVLMHADGDGRLSPAASAALARAENAMDAIKARLFFETDGIWVDAFQLNIDGDLLEWKEY